MNPASRSVLTAFARVLAVLGALGLIAMIASAILLSRLFRTQVEAPVPDSIALQRLEACWPSPGGHPANLLSYQKEVIWDGTTHEDWVVLVNATSALDLDQRTSAFLEMDNSRGAWPLPEAATAAGYGAASSVVYQASKHRGGSGSEPPTMTEIHVWPAHTGWIVRVRHTVVD